MTRTVTSIVNGRPVADSGPAQPARNPARLDETVAHVHMGNAETFMDAALSARSAQREWATVPAPIRGRVIAAIGRIVESNKEALSRLVTAEIGKPLAEARGEVQEIVDTCDFFVSEGRRLYGQTVPSELPDKALFTVRRPVGVFAAVTAGNFPVAVPAWYVVPALLAGNAVVWKPADYAAASADALFRLFEAGGLPPGVLNLVVTGGAETAKGLEAALEAGVVDKVGFTGSTEVGRQIGELCGRHLQNACLELGGKNPMVVWDDADIELAVEGALFSGFGTAGQRCTSLGTVIVHDAVYDEFTARFRAAVEAAPVGDPTEAVLFGPMLHEKFADRFERYMDLVEAHHSVSGSQGTGRITSANPRAGFVGDPDTGIYCHPMIVEGLRIDDDLPNTETFGPLVGVARVGDFDEALEWATAHGYGLSASVYTSSPNVAFRYAERVGSGMVSINNSTSGAEAHLPFGGNGRSGNGSRQSGMWVLDQVTRWQAVNWDYSGRLQKAQMDTAVLPAQMDFRLES